MSPGEILAVILGIDACLALGIVYKFRYRNRRSARVTREVRSEE